MDELIKAVLRNQAAEYACFLLGRAFLYMHVLHTLGCYDDVVKGYEIGEWWTAEDELRMVNSRLGIS